MLVGGRADAVEKRVPMAASANRIFRGARNRMTSTTERRERRAESDRRQLVT